MTTKHSLISPSNFERRMLCPGSLNAEKDLPEVTSKYAEEGKMLHHATRLWIEEAYNLFNSELWRNLTEEQQMAVTDAGNYYHSLVEEYEKVKKYHDSLVDNESNYNKYISLIKTDIFDTDHERWLGLSFIYPEMQGTADTIFIVNDIENEISRIHVIDYKFGRGVAVSAYQNFQLILYYLGVINNYDIMYDKRSAHFHIVQPYVKNSRWNLTEEERLEVENLQFYQDVAKACYAPDAKRIASKKACQFCKAKPTCPALAKTLPKLDVDVFNLEDDEIAAIYDNRELTNLYLSSIEEYVRNKISQGGFPGYQLVPKLSNRRWTQDAEQVLENTLREEAFEVTKKLISIGKAERLLGKTSDIIDKITTKEVIGQEIIKTIKL